VKCFAVYRNKELVVMVIEHCNGPTLQAAITDRGRIPEKEAVAIMRQLIKGIAVPLTLRRKCTDSASSIVT
jgi:serine/threonine protein kinase